MTTQPNKLPVPDLDWYRDVVENAPDTINMVDPNGIILFHNNQSNGIDPADLIGHSIYEYFLPEFYELVRDKIAGVFRTGQIDYYELASDYAPGGVRWYMTRLGPIARDGKVVAVSLFIRDITELKRTQQALSQVNESLEQRVEERTRALIRYASRLEATEKLNAALRQAENRQQVFEILAGHSRAALDGDLVGIYTLKETRLEHSISLQHNALPPALLDPLHDPVLFRLMQSNTLHTLALTGAHEEAGCQFCAYIRGEQMRALLAAPLRAGAAVVGVIYLGFRDPHENSVDDEQLLNTFVEAGSNTLHRILVTEQLEENFRRREHELHTLYEIMSIASVEQDQKALLEQSLKATLRAVDCCTGLIHLENGADRKLRMFVSECFSVAMHDWLRLSGADRDLWRLAYEEKRIVQVRRQQTQSYHENSGPGVVVMSYLGAPIRSKDRTLGVLSIFGEHETLLEPGVIQLVGAIADQIGLALESTIQRKRDNEALILEERQRLARELHDSVSQSLYGLVLSADIGKKFLKLKAYPRLTETLQEIGDVAIQSLKEMRLMLFELRPLSLDTVGLVGALDLRLNTVERRAGMQTSLEVTGREYLPRSLDLEIYRIATEALNNSLKHARASEVAVTLTAGPSQLELRIIDNGQGFEASPQPSGGIGLSSMKERSNRIGGQLEIETLPNAGTTIRLVVPLRAEQHTAQEEG